MKVAIGPSSFAEHDQRPLQILKQYGIEVIPNPYSRRLTEEETILHLKGVDGLIAGLEPLNRRVLQTASGLKAIARVGVGMDNIDFSAAGEMGIKISNTPDAPTEAVAELTLAALLNLLRGLQPLNQKMHEGKWEKNTGWGLRDTKVLIIGYGRIGRTVAEYLIHFGADVYCCDTNTEISSVNQQNVKFISLEEGLKIAKVISLHAGGKTTILGKSEFDLMQDGIYLLNSARGELVNEQALIEALDCGKVAGAWFDVFWQEPYSGGLLNYENVVLTPHISTYTFNCRLSMETEAVQNLLRDLGVAP